MVKWQGGVFEVFLFTAPLIRRPARIMPNHSVPAIARWVEGQLQRSREGNQAKWVAGCKLLTACDFNFFENYKQRITDHTRKEWKYKKEKSKPRIDWNPQPNVRSTKPGLGGVGLGRGTRPSPKRSPCSRMHVPYPAPILRTKQSRLRKSLCLHSLETFPSPRRHDLRHATSSRFRGGLEHSKYKDFARLGFPSPTPICGGGSIVRAYKGGAHRHSKASKGPWHWKWKGKKKTKRIEQQML